MITSSIDDSSLDPAVATRRAGGRLRRSMAGLAVAALLVSACGSDDAVSSDAVSSDAAASDGGAADVDAVALQQIGPIAVTGAALDPYDSGLDDLSVGVAAPVVEGESFDGTPITIGGPTGNATLLVFLAHWCPHCNDEVPALTELEAAGRLPAGLDVIGVSTAAADDRDNYPPSEWLDSSDWPWPTMVDDDSLSAINALGGNSFPFAVVLDADGNVLARKVGKSSADDIVAFLDAALADA